MLHGLESYLPLHLLGVIYIKMVTTFSFLTLTGFSREAFEEMHQYQYENVEERYGAGRPRILNIRDELGLILFNLGSTMKHSELCLILGCTPTSCSVYINHQLTFLSQKLRNHPKSIDRIFWQKKKLLRI